MMDFPQGVIYQLSGLIHPCKRWREILRLGHKPVDVKATVSYRTTYVNSGRTDSQSKPLTIQRCKYCRRVQGLVEIPVYESPVSVDQVIVQ